MLSHNTETWRPCPKLKTNLNQIQRETESCTHAYRVLFLIMRSLHCIIPSSSLAGDGTGFLIVVCGDEREV